MKKNNSNAFLTSSFSPYVDKITALIILPLTVVITFLLIYHLDRGIDLSDEGFYLVFATQAANISTVISSFGFYTGILFEWLDRDLFLFRVTGLFLLIGFAVFFINSLITNLANAIGISISLAGKIISYSLASLAILTYYQAWIVTPSYNVMSLLACLLVGTGLIRLVNSFSACKKSYLWDSIIFNSALVGLGYFLAIMSKPTTALCLGIISVLWIFFTAANAKWLKIILCIALTTLVLLILHVFFIEASIDSILIRTLNGIEFGTLAETNHGIYEIFKQLFNYILALPGELAGDLIFPSMTMIILLFCWHLLSLNKSNDNTKIKMLGIEIIICIGTLAACLTLWAQGFWDGGPNWVDSGYTGIALVLFFAIVWVVCSIVLTKKVVLSQSLVTTIALITLNLSLAFSFGFGSNNGAISNSSLAYIFYVAAIFVCVMWISKEYDFKIYPTVVTSILVFSCGSMLYGGFAVPYRISGSILNQNTPVTLTNGDSKIFTDAVTATYINQIQNAAIKYEWQPGTMLIDMTGGTPLASYLLDAKPVSVGWMLGGYKGADNAAYFAINKVDKSSLDNAWVLTCSDCKRQISLETLQKSGINLKTDFKKIAQLKTGFRNESQTLWKPND
jgi:hypothetical protein